MVEPIVIGAGVGPPHMDGIFEGFRTGPAGAERCC